MEELKIYQSISSRGYSHGELPVLGEYQSPRIDINGFIRKVADSMYFLNVNIVYCYRLRAKAYDFNADTEFVVNSEDGVPFSNKNSADTISDVIKIIALSFENIKKVFQEEIKHDIEIVSLTEEDTKRLALEFLAKRSVFS